MGLGSLCAPLALFGELRSPFTVNLDSWSIGSCADDRRVYMTTVLAATLVPFALVSTPPLTPHLAHSIAPPVTPTSTLVLSSHQYYYSGRAWSTFKCVLLTAPAYVYATIPMFWVVGRASILGNLDRGLGVWWGTYCVPEVPMWRKGECYSNKPL